MRLSRTTASDRSRRLVWLLLIGLLACGTAETKKPRRSAPAAPSTHEGALSVYLQPFPPDAARLGFRFTRISAVRSDGTSIELTRHLDEPDIAGMTEETRLASAALPPGQYRGLAIEVADAVLEGQEGPADLVPPEQPVQVDVAFRMQQRWAVVLSLRFDLDGSIEEGFRFSPVFVAETVPRPAVGLLGLASNRASDDLTIFDKSSGRVVGMIPLEGPPVGLAMDEARQRVYVSIPAEDTVFSIGLLEYAVLNRGRLRGGDAPTELALTPDGATLLAANSGSQTVSFIEPESLIELDRVDVGEQPRAVIVDAAGARAYVFNTSSSSVSVLDIPGRRLVVTIGTEAGPFRGELNRDGDTLYVIHRSTLNITAIDTATLAVRARFYVGPGALELVVDPQTDLIYLSRRQTGAIEIFDPLSLLPIDTIPVESDVTLLAIDVELNYLYALLPERREVQIFGVVGKQLQARAEVGDDPFWVVLHGGGRR